MAGHKNSRVGAVGMMGQSGDWRGAFRTHFEEMILTDSAKCVFEIGFNNKPILP